MSAVPALAAPGRVEARHRSCMPHACSRHACIASSVVGLAAAAPRPHGRLMVGAQLPPMRASTWLATAQAQSQAAKHRPPSLSASTC
jgi:hypothetical protein